MKSNNLKIKVGLFLMMGVFLIFSLVHPLALAVEPYCKTVYCNDFNYICCGQDEQRYYELEVNLKDYTPKSDKSPVSCPSDSDVIKCVVNLQASTDHLDDSYDFYVGTGTCNNQKDKHWPLTEYRWVCEQSEKKYDIGQGENMPNFVLERGQKIYGWSDDSITITSATVYRKELRNTGKATDFLAGVKVQGSVGCDFNPNIYDKTYDDSQRIISGNQRSLALRQCYSVTSYSLRRECGNTCEQCRSDVDCANLYPKQVNYNGRTLGAVCSSGQMILYGCVGSGQDVCIEKDVLPSTEKCIKKEEKKICDIVTRITTGIECCTSDDCRGVGDYYCNWIDDTHSKCELKAQCQRDSDCGTATKCDRQSMQIIEPYCDSKKQCKERTLKKVDCCSSTDCQAGYYCTSDYKCEKTPQTKAVPVREEGSKTSTSANNALTGLATSQSSSSPLMQNLPGIIAILVCLFLAYALYKSGKKTVIVTDEEDEPPKVVQISKRGAFCDKCGSKVKKSAKFCDNCGEKII